jgi:hypothetical protein
MQRSIKSSVVVAIFYLLISICGSLFIAPPQVAANAPNNCAGSYDGFLGFPTWYKYLDRSGANCDISFKTNPDTGRPDIFDAAGKILLAVAEILLRVAALVAVGFIIMGGYNYMMSQGDPQKTVSSKNTIINAVVGLVIALLAVAIVNMIGRVFI